MDASRPYRLAVLVSAEMSKDERTALESLLSAWASEHGGSVSVLAAEEKRRLGYPIKKSGQATILHFSLAIPVGGNVHELVGRLAREAGVLRTRVFRGAPISGKRVKDVPVRRPETGDRKVADLPTVPLKQKAPLEKLEEKIDEILKEEVL